MLGVCCHWIEQKQKTKNIENVNIMHEKLLQLGRYRDKKYSNELIRETYRNNVENFLNNLPMIRTNGIKLFRISSSLLPLFDQVEQHIWDNDEIKGLLKRAGKFIKDNSMRVTFHPGQFCVLSSDSDRVFENSVKELEMHNWIFDTMGLDYSPFYAINVHGGKKGRSSLLIDRIKSLPLNIKSRLTLENDENCYSVKELLPISIATNVPVVFDSHHHVFNDQSMPMNAAYVASCETWGTIKPLQHISNTEPEHMNSSFTQKRKHSQLIHYVPEIQLKNLREDNVDVEVEAKLKNISVFKMSKDFNIPL